MTLELPVDLLALVDQDEARVRDTLDLYPNVVAILEGSPSIVAFVKLVLADCLSRPSHGSVIRLLAWDSMICAISEKQE